MPEAIWPPIEVQALHEPPPSVVVLSQRALSVPRTKTSIAPLDGEVAAGDEVEDPAERSPVGPRCAIPALPPEGVVGAADKEIEAV